MMDTSTISKKSAVNFKLNVSLDSLVTQCLVVLTTLFTALLGAALRGDWIMLWVHWKKSVEPSLLIQSDDAHRPETNHGKNTSLFHEASVPPENLLAGVHWYVLASVAVSFISYLGFGGYLQWHYYIRQRKNPESWKCQPGRFLTKENERHEILLGSFNMFTGASVSGVIACYILNGGYTTLYYSAGEKGWMYLCLTTIFVFLCTDAGAYYAHRLSHIPSIYKTIHKHHHRYHTPTAFSATAMHPAEFLFYQAIVASPAFLIPVYSGSYLLVILYGYYYGMVDHSGILMEAFWPWQPHSIFHDDHHRYFHVNFGFNTKLWDWMHDTLRQDDREYGEDIFYGRGRAKH